MESLQSFLLDAQNPDGGWGYRRGAASNTEVTALGQLALASSSSQASGRATRWLTEAQSTDGGWASVPKISESSWPTALAVLALSEDGVEESPVLSGARWLVSERGKGNSWFSRLYFRLFPARKTVELDAHLIGWPWYSGTFSWVEPTAYALLALKRVRFRLTREELKRHVPGAGARIREAEAMLVDRVCEGGGWNYGNTIVLGEELWPYPDTTALALLALQDVPGAPEIDESLAALVRMVETETSGLALALAVLSLQLHDRDVTHLRARLTALWSDSGFLGEIRSVALAALALDETRKPLTIDADA